ncbi:anti-phage ZorAB system protein ZorA [Segnochrobactraceae bacterium EtOH-i3]
MTGLLSLLWRPAIRIAGFWALAGLVAAGLTGAFAPLGPGAVLGIIIDAFGGDTAAVSTQPFAFSLAIAIGAAATGLALSYFVFHVVLVVWALGRARARVERTADAAAFAAEHAAIARAFARHPVIGPAWRRFDATLVTGGDVLSNTLRPQTFLSFSALKDRLSGLKIMPAVPGYFVGLGLLLTFIGLVIALAKATAGTEAARLAAGGAGAEAMQVALRELLQAATFKFSTSIAGLAASIALSVLFRVYTVTIEQSLGRFCAALEDRLVYVPPQSVTLEMLRRLDDQLGELKQLTSGSFGTRIGAALAEPVATAMKDAITPLAQEIRRAAGGPASDAEELTAALKRFADTLSGSGGADMRSLGETLAGLTSTLSQTRAEMSGSGADFARRMTEAAERLNGLVGEVGASLAAQAEENRRMLREMLGAVHAAFEEGSTRINAELTGAAEDSAARLEAAMNKVMTGLQAQVANLGHAFGTLQASTANHLEETRRQVAEAQLEGVSGISTAAARAAATMEDGLGRVVHDIRVQVDAFVVALRTASGSLAGQTQALDNMTGRARENADLLGRSAETLRAAIDPVGRANERLATAATAIGEAVGRSVASLGESHRAAAVLADTIIGHIDQLNRVWDDYQARFGKVDEDLQRAFEALATESLKQAQLLVEQSQRLDRSLTGAVDRLAPVVQDIGASAGDLAASVDDLKAVLWKRARTAEQ